MIKKIIYSAFTGALLMTSCTKDFEDTNNNPNNPEDAPMANVLAYATKTLADRFGRDEFSFPASYVGHVAKGNYIEEVTYHKLPPAGYWDYHMTNIASNINKVLVKAEETETNNIRGAALVIDAYSTQMLVDAYGPIPYFERGQGIDNITPKYDSEQIIYTDLFAKLKLAASLLKDEDVAGKIKLEEADVMFGGNISKWEKFANSLRLRLAIRVSKIDKTLAETHIKEILDNPTEYPVFESNADNAQVYYDGGDWIQPWTLNSSVEKIAEPIVDTLKKFNDPRLAVYAETNGSGEYLGIPVGLENDDYSDVGIIFSDTDAGYSYLMNYAEVEFIKAEAYKLGLATGDAQTAYENAITASLGEYNLDASAYLTEPGVAWNDDVNQIYIQKWIALFHQSWEAWAEMRRTDVPALDPAEGAAFSGHNRPPFRFAYPENEKSLNTANVDAAGVNEVDVYWGDKIWWDTRTGVN